MTLLQRKQLNRQPAQHHTSAGEHSHGLRPTRNDPNLIRGHSLPSCSSYDSNKKRCRKTQNSSLHYTQVFPFNLATEWNMMIRNVPKGFRSFPPQVLSCFISSNKSDERFSKCTTLLLINDQLRLTWLQVYKKSLKVWPVKMLPLFPSSASLTRLQPNY